MAFVNEKDKQRTIDYERDAILTLGAEKFRMIPRVPSNAFTLTWNGEQIEFVAKHTLKLLNDDGSRTEKRYEIVKCFYPEKLKPLKAEIIQLVTEALDAYGISFSRPEGTDIFIKIPSGLGNLTLSDFEKKQQPSNSSDGHQTGAQ